VSYTVKETYYTMQGEGAQTGRAAVFCRFAGCNLWTGREEDRAGATCDFCDTDFVGTDGPGGGRYPTPEALAQQVRALWGDRGGKPLVVCTGGEPLLQLDSVLCAEFRRLGFEVAIETNGTMPVPEGVDWVCVSPKAGAPLVVTRGDELKLVFPQDRARPEQFADLDFDHFLLQPMDGPRLETNTKEALAYCLEHPQWRLSLQTHKILSIP